MSAYTYVIGPMLLSIFVNTYIAGLVGVQYANFKSGAYDVRLRTKIMVFLLWVIDLYQTSLTLYMIWIYFVTNYVNPVALEAVSVWTFTVIPLCSSLSSTITHIFMILRILAKMDRKRLAAWILGFPVATVAALGLVVGVSGIIWDLSIIEIANGTTHKYNPLLISWMATRLAVDIVLSCGLSYLSLRETERSKDARHPQTTKFFLIANQSGALASLFSLLALVTCVAKPKSPVFFVFLLPSGRLYSSAVLTYIISFSKSGFHRRPLSSEMQWAAKPVGTSTQGFVFATNARAYNAENRDADLAIAMRPEAASNKSHDSIAAGSHSSGPSNTNSDNRGRVRFDETPPRIGD